MLLPRPVPDEPHIAGVRLSALGRWYFQEIVTYGVVLVAGLASDVARRYRAREREAARLQAEAGRLQAEQAELRARTAQLQAQSAELQTQLAEARLAVLRTRLNPHFLFNTLNSIAALIREDPERAERTVERLAALLRFSLDSSHRGTVPLDRELTVVEKYLEIERVRFGDRLRYAIDVAAELRSLEVPPLALQTLVENSVKYAVSARREGAEIRVDAERDGDRIALRVSDDGPGFTESSLADGHGLHALRERLDTLYGGAASLEIASEGGRTVVAVIVPPSAAPDERETAAPVAAISR
jgi:two-component system, LytTR family, sensor histidine kinase AlgZ